MLTYYLLICLSKDSLRATNIEYFFLDVAQCEDWVFLDDHNILVAVLEFYKLMISTIFLVRSCLVESTGNIFPDPYISSRLLNREGKKMSLGCWVRMWYRLVTYLYDMVEKGRYLLLFVTFREEGGLDSRELASLFDFLRKSRMHRTSAHSHPKIH